MKEFSSFGQMAAFLSAAVVLKQRAFEHELLEHACVLIETRAKDKIGEYQSQAGSFEAWQALAESTKEDRVRQGYAEDEPGLRSGEMRDEINHKVALPAGHVGSDDDKLLWFELGTDKQPPRSVLGNSAFELEPKIREEIGLGFVSLLSGGSTKVPIK